MIHNSLMMELVKTLCISTFLICILSSCQDDEKSNLTLLSNQIPTDTALVFGQGIISTSSFEFAITFNPEMDELFFTRREPEENNEILTMKLVDGHWTDPEPAFFKAKLGWNFEPHISPDGSRLYFGSTRPHSDSTKSTGLYQWYCVKTDAGWSEPSPLEKPFSDRPVTMYLTSTEEGNLYFTTGEIGVKPEDWVIYTSVNENGHYSSVRRMGKAINFKGKYIAHSFIAPDESYIIYDAKRSSGQGGSDLYISFNRNGQWTKALNMGPRVNTHLTEMCPNVSPDQRYLFFHRGKENQGNIYWIEFQPIKAQLEIQSKNRLKK